ncbi:Hypothetical protein A7982_06280 [Minicystis rosea]|nr:Hypothetical protein A7982_06280 [Minicystis rosea]
MHDTRPSPRWTHPAGQPFVAMRGERASVGPRLWPGAVRCGAGS